MLAARNLILFSLIVVITIVMSKMIVPVFESLRCFSSAAGTATGTATDNTGFLKRDEYFNRRYFGLTTDVISYAVRDIDDNVEQTATEILKTRSSRCVPSRTRSHVREFKKADVVRCLDSLSVKRNRRLMHIAFIGDSTVRQHFVSFIRWIPDYDRKISRNSTMYAEYYFHEDRNLTIPLLDNLLVSFYWRRLIQEDLIADFKRWASTDDDNQVPDFIILGKGVTAHHITENRDITIEMYEKLLENELMPLINKSLNAHPHQEIVWLQQSPTIQTFRGKVYTELIVKYNQKIRRIFKNTRVVMWDAINAVVEEYVRSCALAEFERQDKWYSKCNDFIHPGFRALSIGTQLIINHLCEKSS